MSEPGAAGSASAGHLHLQPIGPFTAAVALLLAALWGGTPVAVQFSVDQLPPVFVAGVRFLFAAVFMLFWCRIEGSQLWPQPGQWGPCVMNGLLLFVQIALFTWGIAHTSASHATVLINTFVFWVAAFDHFITRSSRLTPVRLAGLLSAAAGALIILAVSDGDSARQQDPPRLSGDLCLAGSASILALKILYTKHALRSVEPGKLMLWHDIVGVALFFGFSALFEHRELQGVEAPQLSTLLGLLYQGVVVSGFCFAMQAVLLKRHSASGISIFSVATPLFGILFGWFFRGDQLSPWLAVSGLCVALGILLVNLPAPSKANESE